MINEFFRYFTGGAQGVFYMDDILIFTADMESHRRIVRQVLQRLQDEDLFLKPEKCFFERDSIEYLGMIISHNQVRMEPDKVARIDEKHIPQKDRDVQSLLCLDNFYPRFIHDVEHVMKQVSTHTSN